MARPGVMYAIGGISEPPPSEGVALNRPELRPELADVGRLLRRGVRKAVGIARADESNVLGDMVREHLTGADPEPSVVRETWPGYEHVNVQAGLEAWLAEPGRDHRLTGVIGYQHRPFGLAELLGDLGGGPVDPFGPRPGAVSRVNLSSGPQGQVSSCVRCGIYLVTERDLRTVVLLRGSDPESGVPGVTVEVIASRSGVAEPVAVRIRELGLEHNVFRGQVLSFGQQMFGPGDALMQFHPRPDLDAHDLVLPDAVIDTVRRQVLEVARHSGRLLAAGQHLKRGLLLYGPPGVGKTHTVRYLLSQLHGTTVIQLSGQAIHLIEAACSVARALQPAMVVVEDVDLIAEERGMHPGQHPMLFQLLNEMDGLAEDADVVFVLTTNRADLLEPALAARPGRVDQAVELALPDADARRRLFELYRGSLAVDTSGLDDVIARTEGVTASFLKELLRRAALFAAERTPDDAGPLALSAGDVSGALDELLATHNAMTRMLLGATSPPG